jgi:hypothetical protein
VAAVKERVFEMDHAPLEDRLAIDELRHAAEEIEHAARMEGIEEHSPLGIFVAAQSGALSRLAVLVERVERGFAEKVGEVREAVADVRRAGEVELEKVRELRKTVEALAQDTKVAMRDAEIRYDEAFMRQVQHIGKKMIGEFAEWRVIVEGAWNRKMKWKWASVACLLTLLVAGAGYGFREWQDRGILQAVARCRESPDMIVPKTGEGGCLVAKLVARETGDVVEDWGKKLKGLWPFGS